MTVQQDITAQLASYKGLLGWEAFTAPDGQFRPKVEIELFCKEHGIPIRKPRVTEASSVQMEDSQGYDVATRAIFMGAPELLTIQVSGWVVTPVTSTGQWATKDFNGNALTGDYANLTNAEIVCAYIEGELNRTSNQAWRRKDPDYYVSPYGHKYNKPIIVSWEPQYTVHPKKQMFTMVLQLER